MADTPTAELTETHDDGESVTYTFHCPETGARCRIRLTKLETKLIVLDAEESARQRAIGHFQAQLRRQRKALL